MIGKHGAENEWSRMPESAAQALDALRRRIAAAGRPLADAGVVVEDKQYSLAFHYRLAADAAIAVAAIAALLGELAPSLGRFGGKYVVNVVASGMPDKGEALTRLVRRSRAGAAFFVGDDVNDEAVFRRAVPPWLTVRIGRDPIAGDVLPRRRHRAHSGAAPDGGPRFAHLRPLGRPDDTGDARKPYTVLWRRTRASMRWRCRKRPASISIRPAHR